MIQKISDLAERLVGNIPPGSISTRTRNYPADGDEYAARRLADRKKRTWEAFIESRGERYRTCRLSSFDVTTPQQRKAIEQLTRFAAELPRAIDREKGFRNGGLLLTGPKGTGKDHLIVGLVFESIRAGVKSIQWRNGPQLFSDLRSGIADEIAERSIIAPLVSCELLCLSDICQAGAVLTDFQQQIVYRILDSRYSALRPVWLTINVANRVEMETMIGPHLADRLIDGSLVVTCNWASYRQPKNEDFDR